MILYKTKESEVVRVDGSSSGPSLKKYSTTITGDGIKTVFTIKHNLGTEDIIFEMNDGAEPALIDYNVLDKNNVNITFTFAPAIDEKYNIKIYSTLESGKSGSENSKPDAITDLTASVRYNYINLSFTIPANAKGVKLYSSINSNVSSTVYEKCSVLEFYEDGMAGEKYNWSFRESNGYVVGTKYYFAIYAYNDKGDSGISDIVNATLKPLPVYIYSNIEAAGELNITGDRFNFDSGYISFCKSTGDNFDSPVNTIETTNTLKELLESSNYKYSDYSRISIIYELDTDCPVSELSSIYLGSNETKLIKLYANINEEVYATSYEFENSGTTEFNFNDFISTHLNEKFSIGFIDDFSLHSLYYFNFKIYRIMFE